MRIEHYWDACCFIAYLRKESGRFEDCATFLDNCASDSGPLIKTSVYTLVEVISLKRHGSKKVTIPKSDKDKIISFFAQPHIIKIICGEEIAIRARDLCWDHRIHSADSIHLATAVSQEIPIFNTFDDQLLNLGKVGQTTIQKPSIH